MSTLGVIVLSIVILAMFGAVVVAAVLAAGKADRDDERLTKQSSKQVESKLYPDRRLDVVPMDESRKNVVNLFDQND